MSTENKVLTSPKGEVLFASLRNPRKNAFSGELEYSVRMEIDGDSKGAEQFKQQLKQINKALVITEGDKGQSIVKKEGNYIVNARTRNTPTVFDEKGQELEAEHVPMIGGGTLKIQVLPFSGKSGKGGGINLVGAQLLEIDEYQGDTQVDKSELQKALQEHHG